MIQELQELDPKIAEKIAQASAPAGEMPKASSEKRPIRRNPYLMDDPDWVTDALSNPRIVHPEEEQVEKPTSSKPKPLRDKRMDVKKFVENGFSPSVKSLAFSSQLEAMGMSEHYATKLQNILETSQPFQTIDYDSVVDTLAAFFSEEENQIVETNLNTLRNLVNMSGNIVGNVDQARTALSIISEIIARHFSFKKKDGSELEKGSTVQNVQGFVERQRHPDNEKIILDCKLPTIILWRLLERNYIYPQVLIRYSKIVPNLSAHPQLYFPTSSEQNDIASGDQSPLGLMTDFTTQGNGFRVVNIYDQKSIEPSENSSFALPRSVNLDSVISQLDIYYLTATLVYEMKYQRIVVSTQKIFTLLAQVLPQNILDDVKYSLSNYVNHLAQSD